MDSHEIRPAMQRGQQKSSAHSPSAMQPFHDSFPPAFPRAVICPSPSCSDFSPLLLNFALLATALCSWGTARCQLQGGELCYPTTKPVVANTRLKLKRELYYWNRQTPPEKLRSNDQNKSDHVLSACMHQRGKEAVPGENYGVLKAISVQKPVTSILQKRLHV